MDAKLVLLGSSGVGKTCIGLRFVKDTFATYSATTIGAAFLVKEVQIQHQTLALQIWDTAGQERFRAMAPLYYRGALAAIIVFALNDQTSFDKLKEWVRELSTNVDDSLVLAIAANKADLNPDQYQVSLEAAEKYAASIGAIFFQTSAKENEGIHELFHEVARRLLVNKFRQEEPSSLHLPSLPDARLERKGCQC